MASCLPPPGGWVGTRWIFVSRQIRIIFTLWFSQCQCAGALANVKAKPSSMLWIQHRFRGSLAGPGSRGRVNRRGTYWPWRMSDHQRRFALLLKRCTRIKSTQKPLWINLDGILWKLLRLRWCKLAGGLVNATNIFSLVLQSSCNNIEY